jgi:hypothetical protein
MFLCSSFFFKKQRPVNSLLLNVSSACGMVVLKTNVYQSSGQVLQRLFLSFKFLFLQVVKLVTTGIRISAFLEVGLMKGLFLLNEKNDISVSIPLVNVEGINKQVMYL